MKTALPIAIVILAVVIALGGFKAVRNAFGREAAHEISRQIFHR